MTLEALVQGLKLRDEKCLGALYDQYASALLGIAHRVLNNREAGEDVLQKSMLKVWNSIQTYDESKSSLFTWMSTIVRNAALDQLKLKSFQKTDQTDSIDSVVYQMGETTNVSSGMDAINLLNSLDPKNREVLDWIYLRGHTQSEVADALSIPLGTVKTRLRTGLNQLREKLKDEKELFLGIAILLIIILISSL